MNVANSVTYLSQDFKLQSGKVGNGGSHFNGQGVIRCAVFVERTGDLIEVAADFSVFGCQLPDGSITDGMGIVDTMNYIKCPVTTICGGLAASFGAVLLANGEKGKRFATPNSEILIHQPLIGGQGGGISGQATEIKIHADHMIRTREKLNKLLSEKTGQPIEQIEKDTERDHYMSAQEALEYGLIDGIMDKRM